jgi:hypothetical protein
MKAASRTRFDIAALRARAGAKVFARGEEYHREGQVELLSVERDRVLAQVAGSEDYRTVLEGRGKDIGGECSCPAYGDWGFCKHMVATALAANAAADDGQAGAPTALERIRAHLKQKGVDALVDMVVALAERDTPLFRKLDIAATAAAPGDDKGLEKRLRRAIDGATRTRGFIDYGEAEDWAENVDAALDAVAPLASGDRAGLAMTLAAHAISRIEGAIEEVDDSDGHCGGLLERASEIHLAACRAAKPDPVELARDLFPRELDADYDTFYGAVAGYAEVLGEAGLAEYRRLATEAWKKLPPPRRMRDGGEDPFRLVGILDFFAERDGDIDARIALRTRNLSSPWGYLQLAEFCLAQGRKEEALRRAEEGLWMFEDGQPDERLVLFVVGLLVKAGRKEEAAIHLWKAFEKEPGLELYRRLRKLGGKAVRERALSYLDARLAVGKPLQRDQSAAVLIELLIEEKMFDAAWTALRNHRRAGRHLESALAEASEKTHPGEAIAVYAGQVEYHVGVGGNPSYEAACRLITRMAGLRDAADQASYVAALKERHRLKRNFMKLLG